MPKPPNLTEKQKSRLQILEPALRNAVRLGNYNQAKRITLDIQKLLRPTGHETRLMQNKNWLFEAAMEAGYLETAITGFFGIRNKTSKRTRIHLEATALLAICYLRKTEIELAEPLMAEVLRNDTVIKSDKRRREFRKLTIQRFEEEIAFASLKGTNYGLINIDEVQRKAGELVRTTSEMDMYEIIGESVPRVTADFILKVNSFSRGQIPSSELKFLPSPKEHMKETEIGQTVFSAMKRVLWRSLCDKNSDVYQAWFEGGMMLVLDRKYIAIAIVTILNDKGIGLSLLAASFSALIIKMGLEVFCELYIPDGVMDIKGR